MCCSAVKSLSVVAKENRSFGSFADGMIDGSGYLREDDSAVPDPLTVAITGLIAAGRRNDAVEHFHTAIGVPPEFVVGMRDSPQWAQMEAVVHTLVYDCMISDATNAALLSNVATRALVLDSAGSTDDLAGWAATVAARLSNATHKSLAGQSPSTTTSSLPS